MKKSFKKMLAVLLAAVIVLTTLAISPLSASAAESAVTLENQSAPIWADAENVLSQTDITDFNAGDKLAALGGIAPFKRSTSSSNYYWFFPSNADLSALKIWFADNATASVTLDGITTQLTSGMPTNVFESINEGGISKVATVNVNSTNYTVTVIKSGDVGAVYIDTNSGSLSSITASSDHSVSEPGSIMVVQPNGKIDYMGIMEKMSGRGNGTWTGTSAVDKNGGIKNPYNIKLAKSTSLLGMNAAKKWCLLANSGDLSLVKNQLTYDFADYIGIKYQPHCKPVDLYVNQQYLGSYQLAEKAEIKSNRINISDAYENLEIANGTADPVTGAIIPKDLTGTTVNTQNTNGSTTLDRTFPGHNVGSKRYSKNLTDITDQTGGYLYELEISERWVTENAGFCGYNRQGWVIKSADYATEAMVDYSYNLLYALGSSVYNNGIVPNTATTTDCTAHNAVNVLRYGSKKITNPAPAVQYQGKKWSDILDADSAVRYYWTQEFFKNMDSSTSSTYFYKDSDVVDSKLYAGPMWDMDNCIGFDRGNGSRWGYSWTSSDGWYTKNSRIYRWRCTDNTTTYNTDSQSPLNFYGALATNCDDFWSMAEKYWYSIVAPAVDIITGKATDPTGKLKSAEEYINTVTKSGIMDAIRLDRNSGTYDTAANVSGMVNWFNERQTWINEQISPIAFSGTIIENVPDYLYTGSEITPSLNITYNDANIGKIQLTEGVDYTLSYANNINTGVAAITATGINGYTGSKNITFNIVSNPLNNGTLSIDTATYANTELNAKLIDSDGNDLTEAASYQWFKNGTAISGATDSSYLVDIADVGAVITVTATGDGKNLTGSITSNACTVLTGTKPESYQKTIAAWDYDYTANSTQLISGDATGAEFYYTATSGEYQTTSNLYASVNAKDQAKVKWSGTADLYTNSSNTVTNDQAPVMGTSKTSALGWGTYPYFETVISTAGFENIKFSAKLGGTKKAPKEWKLQYSTDGINYTDVSGAVHSIAANKTMEQAFNEIQLPAECNNIKTLYIRMVVCKDLAINGTGTIVNQTSGDAAVNNIKITGASLSVITSLYAPTVLPESGATIFDDNSIVIKDNNGGADVYYSVNSGEPALYTEAINPFDSNSKIGDTATITAYSAFNDIKSDEVTTTVTYGGININSFNYDTYSTDVTNAKVQSTGGTYGKSGSMTALSDGKSQYVPLWNESNKAFCIAPDDGAKWSENSGFTYEVSTAGFENITFSCKAYTTLQGPKSVTLQYSTDGENFTNVKTNAELSANAVLEQLFLTTKLPAACNNLSKLYIRLATTEDITFSNTKLHNEASKGNLYVNDVTVSGENNGEYKMPYTNKSTNYFGDNGIINYTSPDGLNMKYFISDSKNNVVQSGTYPATGIQLSTVKGFNNAVKEPYTVAIWVEEDDDTSKVNTATYYYKGSTVVKFDYTDETGKRPFEAYVSSNFLSARNTGGANTGKISMYPNGTNASLISHTNQYGVKATWSDSNKFVSNKTLDKISGNGYWLIETSTKGFHDLTLNLDQISSDKGPRDWGIAYSTNGTSYTYVDNSNVRAISNDTSTKPVETYGNLPLPAACDNQEKLYIKIFINGGESVDGTELELTTKGNTGINNVEISGIPNAVAVQFNTTLLEKKGDLSGNINVSDVDIYVNNSLWATTDENGLATIKLAENSINTVTLKGNGITPRTVEIAANNNASIQNIALMAYDVNNDGYVNAKDFAVINRDEKYTSYKQYFNNFINVATGEFVY